MSEPSKTSANPIEAAIEEEKRAPQVPFWKAGLNSFKDLCLGLFSPDRPTRRMSLLFFASLFGIFIVLIFGAAQVSQSRKVRRLEADAAQAVLLAHERELHRRQLDDAERKAAQLSLGSFMIELRPSSTARPVRALSNLAEIELFLECNSKETRDFIEAHLAQARGNVAALFAAMDRSELLSKEGKRRLKKMVLERLNLWLAKDSAVREVFITKLVLN